ncbi:hypothetical protein NLI96_g12061 [Meripilus lineatus]|uniref:Uncharacterized protein n=1 Tax=Meripilus lineatus TaxID=2056292 RepID=A0AAD5UT36_9APHY|nr:hypothetical protein NLI96_g12061 [Physisporinus lineatus]
MSDIPSGSLLDTKYDTEDMPPLEGGIPETKAEKDASPCTSPEEQPLAVHKCRARTSTLSHRALTAASRCDFPDLGTYMRVPRDSVTVVLSSKFACNADEEANGKPREPIVVITQFEGGGTVIHISPPMERASDDVETLARE